MVAVIDYGMGNLRSVLNAMEHLGAEVKLVTSADELDTVDKVILPGVGAFRDGIRNLDERGLTVALRQFARRGGTLLGICLGMQLLASTGHEHGQTDGLGLIPGTVDRLDIGPGLRVPHVGWNTVTPLRDSNLMVGLPAEPIFYFVHSYQLVPEIPSTVTGTTEYGQPLAACVERANILGVQFHPEKSQRDGLMLLKNFLAL
jgi:imidazole glycerol-phosphate synthase subunit HisH